MNYFIVLCLIPFITCQETAGPIGTFVLTYGTECSKKVDSDFVYEFELKNVDGGKKALYFHVEIPEDIDDKYTLFLTVDKYDQGVWQNDFYKTSGGLLELINKYIPKVYDHIKEQMSPGIDGNDLIPAGKYDIKDFQDIEDSISLPKIFYGTLRITFQIADKNSNTIVCAEVGAESKEK